MMAKKGNRDAQRKRRKERMKNKPPKQDRKYLLIDGNWSFYPVAECRTHNGYLTEGLIETHRCRKRNCVGFLPFEEEKVQVKEYSFYCIDECPIGKPKAEEYLQKNNSGIDAAIDMQFFVNRCIEVGCPYEKERKQFKRKVNADGGK